MERVKLTELTAVYFLALKSLIMRPSPFPPVMDNDTVLSIQNDEVEFQQQRLVVAIELEVKLPFQDSILVDWSGLGCVFQWRDSKAEP